MAQLNIISRTEQEDGEGYLSAKICRTSAGVNLQVIEPEPGPQYSAISDKDSRFRSVTICVRRVSLSRMVHVVAAFR